MLVKYYHQSETQHERVGAKVYSSGTVQLIKKYIYMWECKWFVPKSISCLSCVIVPMRVVLRKTGGGDWCFDYLSGNHLQSQVKSCHQMMVFIYYASMTRGINTIIWQQRLFTWLRRWLILQIGLHTNPCFCLHETSPKNHLRPVSLIPGAEPTWMSQTGSTVFPI